MKRIDKKLALPLKRNRAYFADKKEDYLEKAAAEAPQITIIGCSCCQTLFHLGDVDTLLLQNYGGTVANSAVEADYGVRSCKTPVLLILGHSGCQAVKTALSPPEQVPAHLESAARGIGACFDEGRSRALKDNILRHVDYEVAQAMERYGDLIKDNKLSVVGGFYDSGDDFQGGAGKIYFTNYNGLKENVAEHFEGLLPDQDAAEFCR